MKLFFFVLVYTLVTARECNPHEYPDKDDCVDCGDFCMEGMCKPDLGCTQCENGYYKDEMKGGCQKCKEGCKSCTAEDLCTDCEEGYYNSASTGSGRCLQVQPNCLRAENGQGCVQCNSTRGNLFFLYSGFCYTCGPGCEVCTNEDRCTQAGEGYYILDAISYQCDPNCAKGSNDCLKQQDDNGAGPGCVHCADGYYFAGNNKCEKCYPSCASCKDGKTCETCKAGYYKNNDDGLCYPCDPHCKPSNEGANVLTDFDGCDAEGKCTECEEGYYLYEGKCYMSTDELCVEGKINPKGHCTECKEKYLLQNGRCVAPPLYCKETKSATDMLCKTCLDGYYLVEGFCEPCDENCLECDGETGECKYCKGDMYPFTDKKKCEPADGRVFTYTKEGTLEVSRCPSHQYLDPVIEDELKPCGPCSIYCDSDSCDSSIGCTKCNPGFYVSLDGRCSSCSYYCAYCDQTVGCLLCLEGGEPKDGACAFPDSANTVLSIVFALILLLAF